VFIGTLSTLGESVNLQRACNVGRLDRAWNPMLNVQAEDRVFRQGQTRNVTITDLHRRGHRGRAAGHA
jgi:SNF2 family DNA or RNA helicase